VTSVSTHDRLTRDLRGFGPLGLTAIVIILLGNMILVPLSAILVLMWAHLSRTPWREIGYVRPHSWILSTLIGVVFGVVFKLAMKAVIMPLLGAPPINQAYHFLYGNTAELPYMLFLILLGAGFGEETLFRGYLFERFGKLFGTSVGAKTATVLITSLWFGAIHYPVQGFAGTENATLFGLVFGVIFAVTGRIWMLMCAHAAFDLTALALIYLGKEVAVAHFFFK
jgi:uncharacterized protein